MPSGMPSANQKIRFYSRFSTNAVPLCLQVRNLPDDIIPLRAKQCGVSDLQNFKIGDRGLVQSYDTDFCLKRDDGKLIATSCPMSNTTDVDYFVYKSFDNALVVGANSTDLMAVTVEGESPSRNAEILFQERDTTTSAQEWEIEDIL